MKLIKNIIKLIIAGALGLALGQYLAYMFQPPYKTGVSQIMYEGGTGGCSAVVVSDTKAITAQHCVVYAPYPGLPVYAIVPGQHKLRQGSVIANFKVRFASGFRDVAVLEGDFSKFEKVRIYSQSSFLSTERTYMSCGYPAIGNEPTCTSIGRPSGTDRFLWRFAGGLIGGMSGGPVLDAETGALVGVNTLVYSREVGGGMAITPTAGLNVEDKQGL